MYSGLLIVLVPLITGYVLPKNALLVALVNKVLSWMVYIILFFMGIGLAFLDNLTQNLLSILQYCLVSAACILVCNLLALRLLENRRPWQHNHRQEGLPARSQMALESLKLCGVVAAGFVIGLSHWALLAYASTASEYALLLLLFLVGVQLRGSGMTLKQIVLNRRGTFVAFMVFISALVGGAVPH